MIIVKLMGGLGNQMFQYAMGRRLSLLRKTALKMDTSFLNDRNFNGTKRKFELDVFSSDIPVVTETDLNKFAAIQNSKFKKGIQGMTPFIYPYFTVAEPTHGYNADILNSPANSLLIGYWQTEKYFLPIQDVIRKDFQFKKPLEGRNKALAEVMATGNSVSMHIRRGDYIQNPETNSFHGICSDEYYAAAIELIKKKAGNIQLYIFSDELEWVKTNMNFDVPVTYVDNNTGNNNYIDMQLMSLCKHNIIANSSFSWWGAWLNNSPGKIVVAPAKWFNDSSINVNDVIPEGWHKL
jgi:hypothetical protein